MKKNSILILSCVLVLFVGVGVIVGILMLSGSSEENKYKRKLAAAEKYVQEENWEDAIVAYREAIEINEKAEDAYYMLAQIYIYQDRMEDAKAILKKGIQLTDSQRLKELYEEYFSETKEEGQKQEVMELAVNTVLLGQIANYDFERYSKKYGSAVCRMNDGQCLVTHKNLAGVEFIYFNTEENKSIVNETVGEPRKDKMPWEISFENISTIISGFDKALSYEELQGLALKNLRMDYDGSKNSYVVTFEVSKCQVALACDEKGVIEADAWNRVMPKYGNDESGGTAAAEIKGSIINAVTGRGVSRVTMYIREQGETSGDVLLKIETGADGSYVMEIGEGEYTAEIVCEDFITEYIDFEVDKWGESSLKQFVISPKLEEGQIRIVLEWGEYPTDLDSHLEGRTGSGRNIHVSFMDKNYDEANLDVDDTSSYGPETVTILDISGEYEYYVHDFTGSGNISTSGAVVKVYLPEQSTPIVYEVPANLTGDIWRVCKISNGTVSGY